MKQGKRKNSAAEPSTPDDGTLPDAAYVDQLLDGAAPTAAVAAQGDVVADAADGVIELPAQCLLRDAVEYQQRLLKCVGVASVVIDVGAIERIDTAFIQVLLAFARNHADAKQSITWRGMNPEFAESVRLLGVQSTLSVPDMSEAA